MKTPLEACRLMLEALAAYEPASIVRDMRQDQQFRAAHEAMKEVAEEPKPDPRTPFGQRVKDQISWANRRACGAENDGDKAAEKAWYGYVQALRWVQSIGSPTRPAREEATLVEVFRIDGGTAKVNYRRQDGTVDRASVVADGWGDGFGDMAPWPPQVGDVVTIFNHQVVIVKERKP